MVKVQRARDAVSAPTSRRSKDICGLILFFLGAASLLCLTWTQPGMIPPQVDSALRQMAGVGSYVLPLLVMYVGAMFLVGFERFTFSRTTVGSLLLYIDFVTWRHLSLIRIAPEQAGSAEGVSKAGGWLGWLFGAALNTLVGGIIGHLFLILIGLIALLLMIDQPFIVMLRAFRDRSLAGAQAAKRLGSAKKTRAENSAKPARTVEVNHAVVSDERSARAARVVEQALVPAERNGNDYRGRRSDDESVPPHTPETEEAIGKGWNLFNLTRGLRGKEEEQSTTLAQGNKSPAEAAQAASVRPADAGEAPDTTQSRPERPSKSKPTPDADASAPAPEAPAEPRPAFVLPPLSLLQAVPVATSKRSQNELTNNVRTIEQTLEQFNIGANVVEVASGPSVTRYEIQLAPGIKVSKIVSLADNLAMSLAAIDVRVEAPIPGKSAIGVEVPNATPVTVSLRECLETEEYRNAPSKLTIALGKDVSGFYKYADLTKMPHLLIGGSTNSGKSVCLNALIASLVYRATPREVRLLMIDPKRVELSLWDGIPHLMHPVVKDVKQAAGIFRAALKEMDRRYDLFATLGTRNVDGFNQRVPETEKLPYMVLIVDELADLMIQQGPEVETSICRLAQLARATGIHLVIATQRPSVDIITGTIKANIASRIAFAVASQVDSRTILDMTGADRLIGRGDMLFMPIDAAKPIRVQGAYLSENETNAIVDYLKAQEKPEFTFSVASEGKVSSDGFDNDEDDADDQFFEQAVRLVVNNGQASTSMLQRRFRIGYTRAARIVEMMEEKGIVGALNGAKPREILVSKDEVEQMFNPGAPLPSVAAYQDDEE